MTVVIVMLVGWMFVFSGSLSDSDDTIEMEPNPNEIVFTVVMVQPVIELIQFGSDGSVKEACFLNHDLAKLRDQAPLDISLFCSEGDIVVKVVAIYGLPNNANENGEFEQSEKIRVVVELNDSTDEKPIN